MKPLLVHHCLAKLWLLPVGLLLFAAAPSARAQMLQDSWQHYGFTIPGSYNSFTSVAVGGPEHNIYISAWISVKVYSQQGVLVRTAGSFSDIRGLAVDDQGNAYVLDIGPATLGGAPPAKPAEVVVLGADGIEQRRWGGYGSGPGSFTFFPASSPSAKPYSYSCLARSLDGRIYVADFGNHRVQVFTEGGQYQYAFGGQGHDPGQFQYPQTVVILPNGNVCVASGSSIAWPNTLQFFTASGSLVSRLTTTRSLLSLATTPDGQIAVCADLLTSSEFPLGLALMDTAWRELARLRPRSGQGNLNITLAWDNPVRALCCDRRGAIYVTSQRNALVRLDRRYGSFDPPIDPKAIPQPVVLDVRQRPGTALVDVDYSVVDADSQNVRVAMVAFKDGVADFANLIRMTQFAEGTQVKIGPNVPANAIHRVTWDAPADWSADYGNVQFEVLAKDDRGLLPLHFITLPANGSDPELKLSKRPVEDADLMHVLFWLIATGDPGVRLENGEVIGVGGAYDGLTLYGLYVQGSQRLPPPLLHGYGRAFLYARLGARAATQAEITRAQSGRYGFESVSVNSVVKLP